MMTTNLIEEGLRAMVEDALSENQADAFVKELEGHGRNRIPSPSGDGKAGA